MASVCFSNIDVVRSAVSFIFSNFNDQNRRLHSILHLYVCMYVKNSAVLMKILLMKIL